MKTLLAAILLATLTTASSAEPISRQIRLMCGSLEDVQATMEKYGEKLIVASLAPNKKTVNMVYINIDSQTSSWFIHDIDSDMYCMSGVGDNLLIPKDSPLNQGIGERTSYK
jgi:pyridoxal/pyridoxine/pyridoxamine kinase